LKEPQQSCLLSSSSWQRSPRGSLQPRVILRQCPRQPTFTVWCVRILPHILRTALGSSASARPGQCPVAF
jgi:hypothetical protein